MTRARHGDVINMVGYHTSHGDCCRKARHAILASININWHHASGWRRADDAVIAAFDGWRTFGGHTSCLLQRRLYVNHATTLRGCACRWFTVSGRQALLTAEGRVTMITASTARHGALRDEGLRRYIIQPEQTYVIEHVTLHGAIWRC